MRPTKENGYSRWSCPDCGAVDYDNPRPCVTALVMRAGRLLLIRRALDPGAGLWDFPGGFLEKGETPEQGLSREISEELGAQIENARLLGFFPDGYGESEIPLLNIVYVCEVEGDIAGRGEEFSEAGWFEAGSFPEDLAFPCMRDILDAWQAQEAP
ncbi:NUDIX domain-containing protein [bacterium]|nr:NUDIX domain-containing protein [bacterium]